MRLYFCCELSSAILNSSGSKEIGMVTHWESFLRTASSYHKHDTHSKFELTDIRLADPFHENFLQEQPRSCTVLRVSLFVF